MNININAQRLIRSDSIWGCVAETRENSETDFASVNTSTTWFQFQDDGTYFFGSTEDSIQPEDLLGPEVYSVDGRVVELGHLNTGFRNVNFLPGNTMMQIYPTTDDRLNCSLVDRSEP